MFKSIGWPEMFILLVVVIVLFVIVSRLVKLLRGDSKRGSVRGQIESPDKGGKFCGKCGVQLREDDSFCPKCGTTAK